MTQKDIDLERKKHGVKYCIKCKTLHLIEYRCEKNQQYLKAKYRRLVWSHIRREKASLTFIKYIGIPLDEFKVYLSSKFKKGMSWENYGDWHLDHIKPFVSYDLEKDSDALACCNYKNIQPLWASENKSKGCR